MKVIRAQSAGACYGVERALDIAYQVAEAGEGAQTLGPLIHNPQVVEDLASLGIGVAASPSDVIAPTVIVRSHGVTPEVKDALGALSVRVVDATCPHVLRAQKAAMELTGRGLTLVIVGEVDHPEVEGLRAWGASTAPGARIVVVGSASQLPDDIEAPVGVVVQTTQPREALDGVVSELEARGISPEVRNTICNATSSRQDAARELSSQVDAMVVVGGHNSSNTTRLFEICREEAPRAFHVETAYELNRSDFEGCTAVGLTAGASTPEAHIAAVEDCLHSW